MKLKQNISTSPSQSENIDESLPNKHQVLNLIKTRRSIMPKDLCGEVLRQGEFYY